ncbi:MAG: hypothetical protein NC299_05785 [Lachnospiraceae bacterium]|nr:hypothetical protein [Ruminococcus sp.]MCM1274862.1 hypothetical protein [Lachnospiraceae bacterium]
MKKSLAVALAMLFGNALPVIVCAACIEVRLWWAAVVIWTVVIWAGYTAVSVVSARRFKRKFGFGYRKYFFLCAVPAFLWLFVFGADSVPWVLCAFASMDSGVYCLLFGGSLLAVWGREEYGK